MILLCLCRYMSSLLAFEPMDRFSWKLEWKACHWGLHIHVFHNSVLLIIPIGGYAVLYVGIEINCAWWWMLEEYTTSLRWLFCTVKNNIAVGQNLYSAFILIMKTNDPLKEDMWIMIWIIHEEYLCMFINYNNGNSVNLSGYIW